jgi:hypothetical protein
LVLKRLALISVLARLTFSGAAYTDQRRATTDDGWGELNSPLKHLGDVNAFDRSILAIHQRAGRDGGIPDRFPGFGRENFSLLTLRISRANSSPADPAPDLPVQAVDFPVYLRLM